MNRTALIVFQKNEILGKVKTRLAATLGDEMALKIYKQLIIHTHNQLKQLTADTYVFYSDHIPSHPENEELMYRRKVQTGMDLGERMKNAFESLFSEGYEQVLIIGTDCAALEQKHITSAITKLELVDVVIGPAEDGGYYLLGMKKLIPNLFYGIEWSTPYVMSKTLEKLTHANLSHDTTEMLSDIDTAADWEKVKLNFEEQL